MANSIKPTTNQAVICIPDPLLRSMFSLLLADSCASVAACTDIAEVLRVLDSRLCQLCVLTHDSTSDMGRVIGQVRQASPGTKIILIAHSAEAAAIVPLFQKGLSDAILRPINPKQAVAALNTALVNQEPIAVSQVGASNPPFASAQTEAIYQPLHLIARSAAMRLAVKALWAARNQPIGVILRGEPGVEFELAAREFQAMSGDPTGYVGVLSHEDLNVESLATQVALERLNEDIPRTYYVPEVEKLSREQAGELLSFLRRERRDNTNRKPFRMVLSVSKCQGASDSAEAELIEALQLIIPAVVTLPPIRERGEDMALLVRRILMDLTAIFPGYPARSLHPLTLQWLCARSWPGNYHALAAAIRSAVMDCGTREITAGHFGKLTESPSATLFDPDEIAVGQVLAAVPWVRQG
jgi:DNA-binding NtrC family response regulator